jgi:hypothetical protein
MVLHRPVETAGVIGKFRIDVAEKSTFAGNHRLMALPSSISALAILREARSSMAIVGSEAPPGKAPDVPSMTRCLVVNSHYAGLIYKFQNPAQTPKL